MEFSVQQHLLPGIVVLVMITVGMELSIKQFKDLLLKPQLPIIGTLIHTLSFPLLALGLIYTTKLLGIHLADATLIGILLIAACPSGGFSNVLALIARVNLPLSVLLTCISSVLSFITVPLLMGVFAFMLVDLDEPISLPLVATLLQLLVLILIPIGLGMFVRLKTPGFVEKFLKPLQNIGQLLLYGAVGLLLVENIDVVKAGIGDALPWSLTLCALNIFVCYQASKFFGLAPADRVTVALEGSIRNLAVALLIAINVLDRMEIAVLPTVYFVAVLIVAMVFAKTWRMIVRP